MRNIWKALFVGFLSGAAALAACADENNLVRSRPDGGDDAAIDAEAGTDLLSCGLPVPADYVSIDFAINAKEQLDLKANLLAMIARMASVEGASSGSVLASDLNAYFTGGAPNLRGIATAPAQSTLDGYITQFVAASSKTWTPADADPDGGGATTIGGKYLGAGIYSATGLNYREATQKILLNGSLYNYGLELQDGTVTEASIDGFLAIFGATPALMNNAGDGGAGFDQLIAQFASQRDNRLPQSPGPYTKIAKYLRTAKAAAAGGVACKPDLDAALGLFFHEWERASYLSVIYFLNDAATNASAMPQLAEPALRSYGAAIGFVMSFKGVPQDRRKITDNQIDTLLTQIGAAKPYQLITDTADRVVAFNSAYVSVGAIFGLTQTEIEDAKKVY